MKDEWQKIIEQNVQEYISKVDFKHPDFSLVQLKKDLKQIVGSEPNVRLKWSKTEKVNELLRDSGAKDYKEIVEKVDQVDIMIYSPDNKLIPIKLII
jgi:hypothetical protein